MPKTLIHIKIDPESIKDARKELLYSQMNLLKITKIIDDYKEHRKKELKYKTKLKTQITQMRKDASSILKALPQIENANQEMEELQDIQKNSKKSKKKKPQSLKELQTEKELKRIQEKLEKLG